MAIAVLHPGVFDQNARDYIESLLAENPPAQRPDCGHWEPILDLIENAYEGYDPKQGESRSEYLRTLMHSIEGMHTYAHWHVGTIFPGALTLVESGAGCGVPTLPETCQFSPEQGVHACCWLERYVAYSQQASPEGYKDFHEDCGLWILAAISGRRVKIPVGQGQYTPLMLALVAKPGTYAKSTTAEVASAVLRAAGLGWLLGSDETTPQKLLTDMAGKHVAKQYARWDATKKAEYRERKAMAAQVGWYYDEFGELVKSMNKSTGPMADLKKLILKFDNCPPAYSTSTVARGREEIEKPFLSFLGVMTPASIKKSAQQSSEEWGDGFWSRFVFSCAPDDDGIDAPFEDETPVPPALAFPLWQYHERLGVPKIEIEEIQDKKQEVVIDYEIVSKVPLPEVIISHKPIEQYWTRYRSALKQLLKEIPEDLKASYLRLPMRALRVAALFASFEGLSHIELRHWAKAQEIAERWRRNLHEFYAQVNSDEELSTAVTAHARTLEDKILSLVEKCEEQGKEAPNMRYFEQYIKNVDRGRMLLALRTLCSAKLLSEQRNNRTTRYMLNHLDDG